MAASSRTGSTIVNALATLRETLATLAGRGKSREGVMPSGDKNGGLLRRPIPASQEIRARGRGMSKSH